MDGRFRYVEQEVAAGRKQVVISDRIQWPRLYASHMDLPLVGADFKNVNWCRYFSAQSVLKIPLALVDQGPLPWSEMPGYVSGALTANGKFGSPQPLVVLLNGQVAGRCKAKDGLGQAGFAASLQPPAGIAPPYEVKLALDLPERLVPLETEYRYPRLASPGAGPGAG